MKPIYCLFFFLVIGSFCQKASANHIVGGEMEMVHLNNYNYQLSLIQYRDAIQQENTVIEPYIIVRVFRKRDNRVMRDIVLYFHKEEALVYAQPECVDDFLKTTQVIYRATVELSPSDFDDEAGYYVAWERCCRNNSIDNIVLVAPNTVGQTYYLEFPPVEKDGVPFVNSSPTGLAPLNDYACVGTEYTADFSSVDADGDELVYKLVTPLDSSTKDALPDVTPAPYPLVPWKAGFSENMIIPGTPPLKIDPKGVLTVTPTKLGLFVFSVLCEEYRNGVKIGETRRDFQLLVIDCPQQSTPPALTINVPGNEHFDPATDIVTIGNDLSDEERCLDFYIIDKENAAIASLTAVPVNFSNEEGIVSINRQSFKVVGDTLKGKICFSACAQLNAPYVIDFIAQDNACPASMKHTVRLQVQLMPPQNKAAYFFNRNDIRGQIAYAGDKFKMPLYVRDDDGDLMTLELESVNFDTTGYGITLRETANGPGAIDALFEWDLNCEYFDLATDNRFTFRFLLKDLAPCNLGKTDTLSFTLTVEDVFADFEHFVMPNVFTPDGNGKNDYFQMCDNDDCDRRYVLPPDNCQGKYESIEIFNRWGKSVYKDNRRDFKWDGDGMGAGVYYYVLKYSHKTIKGHLTLLK